MNAAALRSERTRKWVADHNDLFFEQLGERLRTRSICRTSTPGRSASSPSRSTSGW